MDDICSRMTAQRQGKAPGGTDSPRARELQILRARRLAFYGQAGKTWDGFGGSPHKLRLGESKGDAWSGDANVPESPPCLGTNHPQPTGPAMSRNRHHGQGSPPAGWRGTGSGSRSLDPGARTHGDRSNCPSELDLVLLADGSIPETQKLRHVLGWAQKFLTSQGLTLSLSGESEAVADGARRALGRAAREHSTDSEKFHLLGFFSEGPPEIEGLSDHPPGEEPRMETGEERERRDLDSVCFKRAEFIEHVQVGPGETCFLNEDNAGMRSERPPGVLGKREDISLHEATKTSPRDGYFWAPLTDSSEDEYTTAVKEGGAFRQGAHSRNSKRLSGDDHPSQRKDTTNSNSSKLKGQNSSPWKTDTPAKHHAKERCGLKHGGFTYRLAGGTVVDEKNSQEPTERPSTNPSASTPEESNCPALDFVLPKTNGNEKRRRPQCEKGISRISGSQEEILLSFSNFAERNTHQEVGQRGSKDDLAIHMGSTFPNSGGCRLSHDIRFSPWHQAGSEETMGVPNLDSGERASESHLQAISRNLSSLNISQSGSEEPSLLQRGEAGHRKICWSDVPPVRSEGEASVLETYFFYLNQLNQIRGLGAKERTPSLHSKWTGFSEEMPLIGHPDGIGEVAGAHGGGGCSEWSPSCGREDIEVGERQRAKKGRDSLGGGTAEDRIAPKTLGKPVGKSKPLRKDLISKELIYISSPQHMHFGKRKSPAN
ncbi:uncharacterized protein LOC103170392 [Ornithorhynchus anatinus]|uniref:uncharacterized protein LOC103170392 n=1 Tax=Ornithorhynchus anatinus TaxID=9258 RepID=UPI00028F34FC|nr:uncharacterized protein LOC103170392 [Ornithorhynchus anatinus]